MQSDLLLRVEPARVNTTLDVIAERMWEAQSPVIPVVDEEQRLLGVVSIFSILRTRLQPTTKAKSVVEKVPAVEDPSDTLAVARLFVKTGFPGLPVVQGGKVAGVISARSVIRALSLRAGVPSRHLAYPLQPLSPEDTVEKARKLLADVGLRLVPVASRGRLEGVVRVYDLARFLYGTPLRRGKLGEVGGDAEYFLDQPVKKVMVEPGRVVRLDSAPSPEDIAEGAVVVNEREEVVGVISPYLLLRRLFPAVEEAGLPVRVEGIDEKVDLIAQRLIYRRCVEVARDVSRRARLLELSLVLKPRDKGGERRRYEVFATVKLDVDIFSAKAEAWDPVQAVYDALDSVYKSFSKAKERRRDRKIDFARLRKTLGF
ncbi:MAG: CBS domain-containing protein [Thermofilum sp.]